jgi:hypothetical protein
MLSRRGEPIMTNRAHCRFIGLLVFLAAALPAHAGPNEGCGIFLDLDADAENWADAAEARNIAYPDTFEFVHFYIGLASGRPPGWNYNDLELSAITFKLHCDEGTAFLTEFELLPPFDLALGWPISGVTIVTHACAEGAVVYFARLEVFYLGQPGQILITEHPSYPRRVASCPGYDPEIDSYCVIGHLGLGEPAAPGEQGCTPESPEVESSSWGSIKALYGSGRHGEGWRPN